MNSERKSAITKCIEKLPHACEGKAHSRDGLQVFQDDKGAFSGYCFACGTYVPNPYEDKPQGYIPAYRQKTEEEIQAEIAAIARYPTHNLPTRMLKKEYLEHFGIKVGVSEEDGETPETVYFPRFSDKQELMGYKVRLLDPKKMWAVGTSKDAQPFGWAQALAGDGKTIYITEGEFDAVAMYQIIRESVKRKPEYADWKPAVISVPDGAGSLVKLLTKYASALRKNWQSVVLIMDQDEAGKKTIEQALKVFPEAKVAELPCKDVNEGLMKGMSKAIQQAVVFRSEKPKNTRIINGRDLHEMAKLPPVWGHPWPWRGINEATRGIRLGETIYLGAGQKQGKSEVVNQLVAHFIQNLGWKCFVCKPEEANSKTYKLVAGKLAQKKFHDPKVEFDEEAYDRAGQIIQDKLSMLNLYQHVGWETLKGDIRAAAADGVKAVFIDPITNLTNGIPPGEANTRLQEIAQELSAMALDLNIVIFIFCHLNNPDGGLPHERGGKVLSSQFAGSRAMARSCNLMLGLEGNRDPTLPEHDRNTRHLVILEAREFGEVGSYPMYWNPETTIFSEI